MILVTGATGFIGQRLTRLLMKNGYKVRVLCRDRKRGEDMFPKADIFRADLSKPETLNGVTDGIETVIHLAGLVSYSKSREEIFAANVDTTRNLLEQSGKVKKFIFSSSVAVYGKVSGMADENYPTIPMNPYGESKLECEKLIAKSGIPYVMLRIAPIYGMGSPSWKKNLKLMEKGFPIPKTKNLTHVVHISDVLQALERSIKMGEGIYNIADRNPIPFMDFVEIIMRGLGKEPKRMPMLLVKAAARAKGMGSYLNVLTINRNYLIVRAEDELGYRPKTNLQEEVKRMVEWYRLSGSG
jgi:nucleoside-diphosphate-sugar epimerase